MRKPPDLIDAQTKRSLLEDLAKTRGKVSRGGGATRHFALQVHPLTPPLRAQTGRRGAVYLINGRS